MKTITTAILVMITLYAAAAAVEVADRDIDSLLDAWHDAVATADEEVFFGSLSDDAVYLGTDPGERWTKKELMEWSKAHFGKESAWSFKPYSRTIYLSKDGNVAWFEELLETWMGVCRGSGVLVREDGGWKIKHYNLAVTVPNELIQNFVDIFDEQPKEREKK
jgi:ketosteroid isomerase-like protein